MTSRQARTAYEIHDVFKNRWSPYAFADRPVDAADLRALFEAARWAASSYNEQPWRYVVARKQDGELYEQVLQCLVEANQTWARHAPVLALGIASTRFARNGKPNKAALHDLGAASAQLTLEATFRGLVVHQMIGIDPEAARPRFGIPDGLEAVTGLAIGYAAAPDAGPEDLRERDRSPRLRRPLAESVFGQNWAQPAGWLEGAD